MGTYREQVGGNEEFILEDSIPQNTGHTETKEVVKKQGSLLNENVSRADLVINLDDSPRCRRADVCCVEKDVNANFLSPHSPNERSCTITMSQEKPPFTLECSSQNSTLTECHSRSCETPVSMKSLVGSLPLYSPNQYRRPQTPSLAPGLATPLVLNSLQTLQEGRSPHEAFPDILYWIEQESSGTPVQTKTGIADIKNTGIEESTMNDTEFLELLIAWGKKAQSERSTSRVLSRVQKKEQSLRRRDKNDDLPRATKKCRHAKRMTEDEEQAIKRLQKERKKELKEERRKTLPRSGVRKSCRLSSSVDAKHF
ncbi:uncharacterized protein LOC101864121 [Aplysia californica]|uniref:Uncharacterized protein LOC101864121 n=1 Tax=Aplysia californica TaxID=6500 RepID=A0ABM1AEX3_APLCA|nr:uncharacterized protein LOC101864121 [Aplysia californica]